MTAPEWQIAEWLNTRVPLQLAELRGRAVVACAFQMLCPGCVALAVPQIKAVHELFAPQGVTVVGLHTVFEHHEAMTPVALKAFVHEYRIGFPVGIDARGDDGDPMPQTMRLYAMRGTPTLVLIDRAGQLRRQVFGHMPDLQLGAEIMALVQERQLSTSTPVGEMQGGGSWTSAHSPTHHGRLMKLGLEETTWTAAFCSRPAAAPAQRRARLRASGKIVAWCSADRPAWLAGN